MVLTEHSEEEQGSEPEPPMEYADMSGPEEDPDDYVEEGEEPRPPWLHSSVASSEVSDEDRENQTCFM